MVPVSYTHLDVYKRQGLYLPSLICRIRVSWFSFRKGRSSSTCISSIPPLPLFAFKMCIRDSIILSVLPGHILSTQPCHFVIFGLLCYRSIFQHIIGMLIIVRVPLCHRSRRGGSCLLYTSVRSTVSGVPQYPYADSGKIPAAALLLSERAAQRLFPAVFCAVRACRPPAVCRSPSP